MSVTKATALFETNYPSFFLWHVKR